MSNADDKDEPFLARWSRRKQDARSQPAEPHVDEAEAGDTGVAASGALEKADAAKEPELDLSKLPKLDELTAQSDFSVFLDKRVPQMLRNAALSRMWSLDPTIRDFIEVAENQWNWNVPGGAPFYEEILTVPGEFGQAVAQAGGEVQHLLGRTSQESDGLVGATAAQDDIQPKYDPPGDKAKEDSAAPHNVSRTEGLSQGASLRPVGETNKGVSPDAGADVALQHAAGSSTVTRRRHGRALPA